MKLDVKKNTSQDTNTQQQRHQAKRVLFVIQWLFMMLLLVAVIWLYLSQQALSEQLNQWQKNNEQTVSRLNDMDDRLYAISQNDLPSIPQTTNNNATNQMELLKIQLQTVDKILADDDTSSAIKLLQGLHWQLSQPNNDISPALTIALKNSINHDIQHLQTQQNQPSSWQLQSLAIQDIQSFLASQIHQNANPNEQNLTAYDAMIYEVMMTLNLAIQACQLKQPDMMVSYLQQAKEQIKPMQDTMLGLELNIAENHTEPNEQTQTNDKQNHQRPDLKSLSDVNIWLNDLIKNVPKHQRLMTTKMLEETQQTAN